MDYINAKIYKTSLYSWLFRCVLGQIDKKLTILPVVTIEKGVSKMIDCIKLKTSNCKNCYKCIRHCPVKSIKFSNNQANIVGDECILCGMCFVVCPQNAKEIRNDIDVAKQLIATGKPVYVSLAPAFVANYKNINFSTIENALKHLGFAGVEETAIGATVVKKQYEEMIKHNPKGVIISSCCHSVNTLIQKYHPMALPMLAKVVSPMQAHCKLIKNQHKDCYTVFIGPCISKKNEAVEYKGIVDCVLTFEELSQWLSDENIDLKAVAETATSGKARLFPTTGGILKTMDCTQPNYNYMAIDGVENCITALKDIEEGNLSGCFIEMSACVGSCIGGPAMDRTRGSIVTDTVAVQKFAGQADFETDSLSPSEISKEMTFVGLHHQMPGTKTIEEILKKMGKTKPEDELNCGSCGYNTCREKAAAVYFGKANITMCLPYLIGKAESFSDTIIKNTPNGIIVLNESLEIQQINKAAREIMNIKSVHDVINEPVVRILDPLPFVQALNDGKNIHDVRVYLAEYDKYVEHSVIYDKSYHILIYLMRDVTEEEKEKAQKENIGKHTVEIADKVIEKQMRVVQEIALLLGETTAETKIALTKLKESLADE